MKDCGRAFYDSDGREEVRYWEDRLGRKWLATGKWSLFRVPIDENNKIDNSSEK